MRIRRSIVHTRVRLARRCRRCCPDLVFTRLNRPCGWGLIRQGLRDFAATGGPVRVLHHVVNPLATALGYGEIRREDPIATRRVAEDGGYLLRTPSGASLRPGRSGRIPISIRRQTGRRAPHQSIATRRPGASGLPAKASQNRDKWRSAQVAASAIPPDLTAISCLVDWSRLGVWSDVAGILSPHSRLASPDGVTAANEIFDAARIHQAAVTKTLRSQARAAIEDFLQCVIDRDGNAAALPAPEFCGGRRSPSFTECCSF